MAHFYGNMQGGRSDNTRCGTKKSGLTAHVRGWDIGVRVTCYVGDDGRDRVRVALTSGSHGTKPDRVLCDTASIED